MPKKISVYVIDDDIDVRNTLTNIFYFNGFQVEDFSDPLDALNHPLKTSDSCILLDLSMPSMNGLLFLRELRKRDIVIPIVIYSGTACVDTAVSAMSGGAYTVLRKPAKKDLLISTVTKAVAEFRTKLAEKALNEQAMEQLSVLSKREHEIALLISEGFTSLAIADKLFISIRTVEAHRAAIFMKLNLKAQGPLAQLVLRADIHKNQLLDINKRN